MSWSNSSNAGWMLGDKMFRYMALSSDSTPLDHIPSQLWSLNIVQVPMVSSIPKFYLFHLFSSHVMVSCFFYKKYLLSNTFCSLSASVGSWTMFPLHTYSLQSRAWSNLTPEAGVMTLNLGMSHWQICSCLPHWSHNEGPVRWTLRWMPHAFLFVCLVQMWIQTNAIL